MEEETGLTKIVNESAWADGVDKFMQGFAMIVDTEADMADEEWVTKALEGAAIMSKNSDAFFWTLTDSQKASPSDVGKLVSVLVREGMRRSEGKRRVV